MPDKTTLGIFIFRRDFRLKDNLGLSELSKKVDKIIGIFIFDPYQIDEKSHNRNYFSNKSVKFMIESLEDLNRQLDNRELQYFYGKPHIVLKDLIEKNKEITHVGFNEDFSPYSKIRDKSLKEVCNSMNIECISNAQDMLLHPIDDVLSNSENPLLVFGSYYKRALKIKVQDLKSSPRSSTFSNKKLKSKYVNRKKLHDYYVLSNTEEIQHGGTSQANKILKSLKKFSDYHTDRDLLNYETTRLSAHLKYGTVSLREVYHDIKSALKSTQSGKALIRQLYWRMFYFILANYRETLKNESVMPGYGHIEKRFKDLKWSRGKEEEKLGKALWKDGNTGFPMIDACIRQLNSIGWMHNRGRLMVASFAVNILHLDPFSGRRWSCQEAFSKELIDCCYANNFGNWMWILGPYDPGGYRYGQKGTFGGRVFKDIISFKEYDPELKFIRKWIPELDNVEDNDIFRWNTTGHKKHKDLKYTPPIVDFEGRLKEWYKMTKS